MIDNEHRNTLNNSTRDTFYTIILTKSSAVKGSPLLLNPTTMLPSRVFISSILVDNARIAIISDPTEIQNDVSLVLPFSVGL